MDTQFQMRLVDKQAILSLVLSIQDSAGGKAATTLLSIAFSVLVIKKN